MSFDEILDLTDEVFLFILYYFQYCCTAFKSYIHVFFTLSVQRNNPLDRPVSAD